MINGRKLFLYANGGKLSTVAWHHGMFKEAEALLVGDPANAAF